MADRKKRQADLPATKEQASGKGPELEKAAGTMATSGIFNAVGVIQPFQKNLAGEDVTADSILSALEVRLANVQAGDMTPVESMLLSQAISLQTIYASLARRAASQEYLKQYQTYLTLALKAQAQSRATLETLIELKQPRYAATFVKQANIAHGPQQVNNGAPSPAGNSATEPNKLLEDTIHEGLDIGAQAASGRGHQQLETVAAVNRAAKRRG
jgi:hypothetical protein